MVKVGIIIGSTRPNRKGEAVGKWVLEVAMKHARELNAEFELIDLLDFNLPLLDEPIPPSQGRYSKSHTKNWSAKITPFDAFVFVTPEYNHSTSAALKNALDFIYKEWNNKSAAFVGYGAIGGARAIESLRLIMGELQVADVREQVSLFLREDFQDDKFQPREHQEKAAVKMLNQVIAWGEALKFMRDVRRKNETHDDSSKDVAADAAKTA